MNQKSKPWWQSFYNDTTAEMFLVRADAGELPAICNFLTEQLKIAPGATVFDQCCGIGSVSIPLARAGAAIIGVDQSDSYIERARNDAGRSQAQCEFHAGDAFEFAPRQACDAAFNWGSSFGYADDDQQNSKMLGRVCDALKPAGRFILDYQNIPHVLRDFRQCMIRRHRTEGGEIVLTRESQVDLAAGRLVQQWTYFLPDGRRICESSSLRLYLPHTLGEMLRTCGFSDITFYGDIDGSALTIDSPRCICRGTKP